MTCHQMKKIVWLVAGALAGGVLTLSMQAFANKSETPLPLSELRSFAEVFGRIKQDYVDPVEDRKLITSAIKGMLTGLDPHSDYMDAEAFKEMKEGTQGEFGGLGIEISTENGLIKVVSPIEDTPAQKAGIKSGDLIIKIEDTPVRGLSLTDAMRKMRGTPGTTVTLTINRKTEIRPLVLTLARAVIKTKSVKYKLLEPDFGYVRITQFQEHTSEELASGVQALYKENNQALKGLILDLRDDPGGLLNGAVGVSAAFLTKSKLVVYTEGRTPEAKMRLTANLQNYARANGSDPLARLPFAARSVPLVVLVNGGSASASEIVAGALQDHKRAVLVGTQTFGKGSVQSIMPLGITGGIKLTTARYFTPNGRSIQAKGIMPDVVVEDGTLTATEHAIRVREADLENHLLTPKNENALTEKNKIAPPPKRAASSTKLAHEETGKERQVEKDHFSLSDPNPRRDNQLSQALNILKVQQILSNNGH